MSKSTPRWSSLSAERRARLAAKARAAKLHAAQAAHAAMPAHAATTGHAATTAHAAAVPTRRTRPDGRSVASHTQEQLWFLERLSGDSAAYLVPYALRLRGPLNVDALLAALTEIADRHEVLRGRFAVEDGELRHVLIDDFTVSLPVEQLAGGATDERESALRRRAAELVGEPFDLATGPLLRTTLLRLDPTDHLLVWCAHHAVADGTSVRVLVEELRALYRSALDPDSPAPPPVPLQYADLAEWERQRLTGQRLERLVDHWREQLGDAPPAAVPADRPRPATQTFRGGTIPFALPVDLGDGVVELSARCGASAYATLLAALHLVLARHSGEADAVIGASVEGRLLSQAEPLIGPFSATIPLRIDASDDPVFTDLLARVRDVVLDGLTHQDIPFGHLVRALGRAGDAGRNPLYQVLFGMGGPQSLAEPVEIAPDLTAQATGVHNGTARLDLQLTMEQSGRRLAGRLDYNSDLYDADTAQRLVDQLTAVLRQVVADPDRPVSEVSLLEPAEQERLRAAWHAGAAQPAPVRSFLERFAEQAAAGPERVAVVQDGASLTYRELDQQSNRVAHAVLAKGGGPGRAVAVGVDRDLALLPVIVGVLKSGSAYVPLDPAFPAGRLEFMLRDSDARLLIHDGDVPVAADSTLTWDDPALATAPTTPVDVADDLDRVAYVMYTSGSTGAPKGVAVGHRALGNFLAAMAGLGLMRRDDTVIALTNLTFDISMDELLLPLTVGARVVVARRADARSGARLLDIAGAERVTVVHGTPATCRLMVEAGWQPNAIRRVLCGGEAMPAPLAADLRARAPEVWNLFGPTEATVWSLAHRVDEDGTPPIGRPLDNTTALVLDESLRPVPPGVRGELCLGGIGLAEGYLNRPDLTAQRFVRDSAGARLYRTGDVASYRPDGVFEFHGRADSQVKLRGFRIELGEVEAALRRCPEVAEAVVLAREFGEDDTRLVAYARAVGELDETSLLSTARASLPEHMTPAHVVVVDEFPLTAAGKIDRKALAALPVAADAGNLTDDPPRTPTERWVADRCAHLLGREHVGRAEDFFVIGGHSLLAVKLLTAAEDMYGTALSLERFFAAPTAAGLAAMINAALGEDGPADGDDLLARIENLTDEEVLRLLETAS